MCPGFSKEQPQVPSVALQDEYLKFWNKKPQSGQHVTASTRSVICIRCPFHPRNVDSYLDREFPSSLRVPSSSRKANTPLVLDTSLYCLLFWCVSAVEFRFHLLKRRLLSRHDTPKAAVICALYGHHVITDTWFAFFFFLPQKQSFGFFLSPLMCCYLFFDVSYMQHHVMIQCVCTVQGCDWRQERGYSK